jgi:hypothetical protein
MKLSVKMPGSVSTACFLALGLNALSAACGSPQPINVGSNDGGGSGGSGPGPAPDDTDACRNGAQLPIVGVWEGYIENLKFASGSDAIRVAVTSATSAQACGKVTLGKGTPPAPATDPDIAYPPGYKPIGADPDDAFFSIDRTEGSPLSMVAGTAEATRFKFGADWYELWQSWCALQTPIPAMGGASFGCLGAEGGAISDQGCFARVGDQMVPLDCGKYLLCSTSNKCTCTMTSCRVERIARWAFDLRITGDQAAGSVKTDLGRAVGDIYGDTYNVYLTRTK